MNWFSGLIVFQFTILLCTGRPETSTSTAAVAAATTSAAAAAAAEQITLKIEHNHHSSSAPSIVQTAAHEPSSPSPTPSSPSPLLLPTAIFKADSKKQPSSPTTVAASTPLYTTKRILSTMAHVKKVSPTKKVAKLQDTTMSASTATAAPDSTARTTRYHDIMNLTHTIMHANPTNRIAKHANRTSHKIPSKLNHNNTINHSNSNNTISKLRELRQQYVDGLNGQYLGSSNIYQINPYLTPLLTTPKSVHTLLSSAPQQTYYIVHPDDLVNFGQFSPNNIHLANVGGVANVESLGDILNVGHPISTNLVSTLSASESYQLPRPPALTVNNDSPSDLPPHPPPPLFHSTNITKLFSIVGSSTPDPYNNFQKVVKFSVNAHRPNKPNRPNNRYGNGQYKRKPINQTNKNHEPFSSDPNQFDANPNGVNKISIVYNESSQFFNANNNNNNNENRPAEALKTNAKNESLSQSKPKECLVTPSAGNVQTENVCNSNDLKIIIKFDGGSMVPNATEKNAVKPKPKKKKNKTKTVIMTTASTATAATAPLPFYDSLSYESAEVSKESDEFSGFFEPIQNLFGFMGSSSSSSLQRRRPAHRPPHKRPTKDKEGHKNKHKHKESGEVVNKYQTIILQTPSPPTTAASSSSFDDFTPSIKNPKKMLYKLFAILSMVAILKPLGFGLWTLILSPLLMITIGGVALGVILYPFLAIAKQQQIHYATARSPRVVIHKHPRPIKQTPTVRRPQRPQHALGPGHVIAKWTSSARRRIGLPRQTHANSHKLTHNNRRRHQQLKRFIPIRRRIAQPRSKRDTKFQQWLLVQNNFNIRIMSPNHDYDYDY